MDIAYGGGVAVVEYSGGYPSNARGDAGGSGAGDDSHDLCAVSVSVIGGICLCVQIVPAIRSASPVVRQVGVVDVDTGINSGDDDTLSG